MYVCIVVSIERMVKQSTHRGLYMESKYQHKILVVDDDKKIGKAFEDVCQTKKIDHVFVTSGDFALEEIKKANKSFSVIITDQGLEGMTGTQILEHAREIIPDTIRVLMTSHSQVDTIINAVNKGAIQNFIVKPHTKESLEKAVISSIKLFDLFLEDKKLLKLAKTQSKKLYELNCQLMDATKNNNKILHELDNEIETLNTEIKDLSVQTPENSNLTPEQIIDEIKPHIKNDQGIDPEKTATLFSNTIKELYNQFNEISYRNGFEMPDIKGEIK